MTKSKKVLKLIWEYLALTVACFIFAISWECFMIPNGMSAGGLMGLCTVIQYATVGVIQAQYSYIVINVLLILVAVIAMGIGFGAKTLYCIAMSSLAMQIVSGLTFMHCIPGEFFFVHETLLIPVIARASSAVSVPSSSTSPVWRQIALAKGSAKRIPASGEGRLGLGSAWTTAH